MKNLHRSNKYCPILKIRYDFASKLVCLILNTLEYSLDASNRGQKLNRGISSNRGGIANSGESSDSANSRNRG